jgi:hypothetical protein
MTGSSSIYCRLRIDCSIAQGEMGAMPLEVGGALRLRLEAKTSRQRKDDGGQKAEDIC